MSEVRPGDVIDGKFAVERVLGEGGMGYVVAARHLQLGQVVALKFIRPEVLTPEYQKRFLREARNTSRLKSKHVARVLDVGALEGGSPFMVMEYLEGMDLWDHLQVQGPLPPAEACEYIIQACEAIAEAHSNGIVHRDLKPANLFLARGAGGETVVKVLDFGVSKTIYTPSEFDETTTGERLESVVTKISDILGSPSYIAPEQIASSRNASGASDIWSLGVILYRLVSGKAPFAAESILELIQAILHHPVPSLATLCPNLPSGFEAVVMRCLDRDPAARPTAIDLARLLAPFAGPNAAPSLERIAILGAALVVGDGSAPSLGGAAVGRSSASHASGLSGEERRTSILFWTLVLGALLASSGIVGGRMYASKRVRPVPAPAAAPLPIEVAPAASTSAPVASASASASPPPSASPVVSASASAAPPEAAPSASSKPAHVPSAKPSKRR